MRYSETTKIINAVDRFDFYLSDTDEYTNELIFTNSDCDVMSISDTNIEITSRHGIDSHSYEYEDIEDLQRKVILCMREVGMIIY